MKENIRKIALASIFASLSVALLAVGALFELLDLTVAAFCSFLIFISVIEIKGKYPFLIYLTTSVLSIIIVPLSTAGLYYIAFFGYYPILRTFLQKKNKLLSKILCFILFNVTMACLMLLFKQIFALQNEPYYIYILLLVVSNIFYVCLDKALNIFAFLYFKKLRNKIMFKF